MLTYTYSLNKATTDEKVELEDMYVSPDLSFASGTTSDVQGLSQGAIVWVKSPFFPKDIPTVVTSNYLVKRNGYILVPETLQVMTARAVIDDSVVQIDYCEYRGNTYYGNGGSFVIDDVPYTASGGILEIMSKIYVEDNKVIVDGITFDVNISNESAATFTDMAGVLYTPPDEWDVTNITCHGTYTNKVSIGREEKREIECTAVNSYGFRAYVVYRGEKYYIQYFEDEGEELAGVVIGENKYVCSALYAGVEAEPNIYNRNSYEVNDDTGTTSMDIDSNDYVINFESGEIDGTGLICIETKSEHLPILIDDKVIIKSTKPSYQLRLKYDSDGNGYVYFNGKRYNVVPNLCDKVIYSNGDEETLVDIEYIGDSGNPTSGMKAMAVINGEVMYFEVVSVYGGRVDTVKRVRKEGNEWVDAYVMVPSGSGVDYAQSPVYDVATNDGVLIGSYRAEILTGGVEYPSQDTDGTYKYIEIHSWLEYGLRVVDIEGSNRLICEPDVNTNLYTPSEIEEISSEIIASIYDTTFIMQKRPNTFGVTDLFYDSWLAEASISTSATSVYQLADIENNINISIKSPYISLPLALSRPVKGNLDQENEIMGDLYDEEAANGINPIVDMEKDMYSPVVGDVETSDEFVEKITFNFHFRTRDMETWKINEDFGSNESGELNANYQYTNWFVTDFFPYNQIEVTGSTVNDNMGWFYNFINRSDLLGLLYFTTNDVEVKREKLEKSFLRLTFFDSRNPETQNMLGTSTIFFDCDRYFDVMRGNHEGIYYNEVVQSRNHNRDIEDSDYLNHEIEYIPANPDVSPTVLDECYTLAGTDSSGRTYSKINYMYIDNDSDFLPRLDSRMVVRDRYSSNKCSEGYYSYILKAFGDKKKKKTIYMKAEFFHAGVGIKIPMIIPTYNDKDNYNAIYNWDKPRLDAFKEGYDVKEVFNRLYIPIDIAYSQKLKQFVYSISKDNDFRDVILNEKSLVFNLFELKYKPA